MIAICVWRIGEFEGIIFDKKLIKKKICCYSYGILITLGELQEQIFFSVFVLKNRWQRFNCSFNNENILNKPLQAPPQINPIKITLSPPPNAITGSKYHVRITPTNRLNNQWTSSKFLIEHISLCISDLYLLMKCKPLEMITNTCFSFIHEIDQNGQTKYEEG